MARPLVKLKENGIAYARDPKIELEIDQAVNLPREVQLQRASLPNTDAAHFSSECLIHLIRLAKEQQDDSRLTDLVKALSLRCERILRAHGRPGACVDVRYVREETLGRFLEMIARDSPGVSKLDFFECRFDLAFRKFRITVFQELVKEQSRDIELPGEGDPLKSEPLFRSTSAVLAEDHSERVSTIADLRQVIEGLPPRQRQALLDVHYLGYDIESIDASKETAAKRAGVSGRTIRTWLKTAEETIASSLRGVDSNEF